MASESSAVLELNDADSTDAEVSDVPREDAAPLIMEHGYDIAVKVDAPMKEISTLETFVTYRVRCVCARWPTPAAVRRRYNHFKVLHRRLSASQPLLAAPALPPLHSARQQLDRYEPGFVTTRCIALQAFLSRVAKHPIFTHSEDFRIFLTTPDEELDKIFKSENSALNLWGLSSAFYGSGENKSSGSSPRVKDPEFTSAAEYLQSLQQKLTTVCTLTNKLCKGTTALGAEMNNMKVACDPWSVSERPPLCRALSQLGAAHAAGGAARAQLRARARAALPPLAAYTAAILDKIRQRDAIHAAYVAGNNSQEDLHNRLEQASEALRSDLSDWLPKTRADIKSVLLDLADKQVAIHTQTLMAFEHALKVSAESNIQDLFKTVSKIAVQNLSPSKGRPDLTPTETEQDFDDIDNYSNDGSDLIASCQNFLGQNVLEPNELGQNVLNHGLGHNRLNKLDLDNKFPENRHVFVDSNNKIDENNLENDNGSISSELSQNVLNHGLGHNSLNKLDLDDKFPENRHVFVDSNNKIDENNLENDNGSISSELSQNVLNHGLGHNSLNKLDLDDKFPENRHGFVDSNNKIDENILENDNGSISSELSHHHSNKLDLGTENKHQGKDNGSLNSGHGQNDLDQNGDVGQNTNDDSQKTQSVLKLASQSQESEEKTSDPLTSFTEIDLSS